MLLKITPSGNELQRKMLLAHSSKMRNVFLAFLLLLPLAIVIGDKYSSKKSMVSDNNLKNVAMILVQGNDGVSQGTAFLVSKSDGSASGYLFTARHVVAETVTDKVNLQFLDVNEDGTPLNTTPVRDKPSPSKQFKLP